MIKSFFSNRTPAVWLVFFLPLFFHLLLRPSLHQHPEVLMQPDSVQFTSMVKGFLHHGTLASVASPERPDAYRTPLYPLFIAAVLHLNGNSFWGVIWLQVFFHVLICFFVYRIAERLYPNSGLVAVICAALNLGLFTYSHFILSDTLFLLLFTIALWLWVTFDGQNTWVYAAGIGFFLGLGILTRPVLLLLSYPICILFGLKCWIKYKKGTWRSLLYLAAMLLALQVTLFPWLYRNYRHFERYQLMAQTGEHLVQYIVPFVWQYSKGIPFIEGMQTSNAMVAEEAARQNIDLQNINPFEGSRFKKDIAVAILKQEPFTAIVKAWMFGIIKNLASPAVVDFSYLLNVKRPHFFAVEGATLPQRAFNFIRQSGTLGWVMLANMAIIFIFRCLQLAGLIILAVRKKFWALLLTVGIIAYFLLVSGPVGYAKYRLPLEPIFCVLTAIPLWECYRRWRERNMRTRKPV